jgi:hypothetical protein
MQQPISSFEGGLVRELVRFHLALPSRVKLPASR